MTSAAASLPHTSGTPSAWVQAWAHLVQPGGKVLDIACGHGRHSRFFAQRGHPVTALDRDQAALANLSDLAASITSATAVQTRCADIENGPYPLVGQTFNAVVVTNYLWRPLFPLICGNVADGGVLIYETFAAGNETVGKPSRPDFLLQPGELLQVCAQGGLRVVAYEDGFLDAPARFVQRVVAVRDVAGSGMRAKRLALRIP